MAAPKLGFQAWATKVCWLASRRGLLDLSRRQGGHQARGADHDVNWHRKWQVSALTDPTSSAKNPPRDPMKR